MPRDGSGNYTKPVNSVDPAVPATTISSNDFNQLTSDLATEMTDSLNRSGKGAMFSALAMGANKITNLGVPSVASDAARLDTVTNIALGGDVTGSTSVTTVANVTGGKVSGLAAGSFATAGKVGEVVTASNTVAVSNGVTANVTSVALTAGNWLLWAQFLLTPAAGSQTQNINIVISATSASLTSAGGYFGLNFSSGSQLATGAAGAMAGAAGPALVSISAPTTYYLNTSIGFTGAGGLTVNGSQWALRVA